jgi:hypothetical protein
MRDRDRRNRNQDPSLIRAIRGPITLITIGVLFALNNFTPFSFDRTWPVLLIVFGLMSLLRRSIEPVPPPPAPFPPPQYSSPWNAPPQPGPQSGPQSGPPAGETPQTGYAQSPYSQAPAKGGFGTSATRPEGTPTDPANPNGGQL